MKLLVCLALALIACKDKTPKPEAQPVAKPAVATEPPAPPKPADPTDGVLVAGQDRVKKQFFIARVTPKATVELFRDASEPTQLLWVDSHFLIAMFEVPAGADSDLALRWFVDAKPSDKRGKGGESIKATAWPEGYRGATTRLIATRSGQVWLARSSLDRQYGGKAVYMRIDAFPRTIAADPPADIDVVRSTASPISLEARQAELQAVRDALPRSARGPDGITLTLKKAAGGIPGVECKDATHTTVWPPADLPATLRIHVEDAHWLSAALPLWTAIGKNHDVSLERQPTDAVKFLGCAERPLADAQWLGGDVWAVHEEGERTTDVRPWTLWNGATRLAVIDQATGSVFRTAPL